MTEERIGPRPDERHRRELPGSDWVTCRGCPSLRVVDWHYFYCRHLGDQSQPDEWSAGWSRLWGGRVYKETAPCGLPTLQQAGER